MPGDRIATPISRTGTGAFTLPQPHGVLEGFTLGLTTTGLVVITETGSGVIVAQAEGTDGGGANFAPCGFSGGLTATFSEGAIGSVTIYVS